MKALGLVIATLLISSCAYNLQSKISTDRHYVVVDVDVSDVKKYDEFLKLEAPILEKFNAYIVMEIRSEDEKKRHIIVSFPSRESVGQFVKSDEFQNILPLNRESSKSKIFHGKLHQIEG